MFPKPWSFCALNAALLVSGEQVALNPVLAGRLLTAASKERWCPAMKSSSFCASKAAQLVSEDALPNTLDNVFSVL